MSSFKVADVEAVTTPFSVEAATSGPLVDDVIARGANLPAAATWPTNGLIATVACAFDEHRPLALSPDDVWIAIAQGFAAHVLENAEALRGRFVRHAGKETIRIRRDELLAPDATDAWAATIGDFSDAVAARIGKQRDLVVCDFSTTGAAERLASEIVLLDAMKEYFDYRALSLCGIPEITLLGTADDWKQIRRRAAVLSEYDLGWWTSHLTAVLDEFVRASEGRADLDRWLSFFKIDNQSGGPFVSGWINDLFPYLTESFVNRTGGEVVRGHRTVRNAFLGRAQAATKGWQAGPTMSDFSQGLSRVRFVWEVPGRELAMELVGGFTGVAQDPGTRALRPAIGWAVRRARS